MKKVLVVLVVAAVVATVGMARLGAYNPGAHIYVAEHALSTTGVNFLYGAMAPDIVWYAGPAATPEWYAAHNYDDFSALCSNPLECRFADGWLTHNQMWGADFFAHGMYYPVAPDPNAYVIKKGSQLIGLIPELQALPASQADVLAHSAVEIAVDLLLKKQDPLLGWKVVMATWIRSPSGPALLVSSGVTDAASLQPAETLYRQVLVQYGNALALPAPRDRQALAQLAATLAGQLYGVTLTDAQALGILNVAVEICSNDYLPPLRGAIASVRQHLK